MGCCTSKFTPEAKKFKQEAKEEEEEREYEDVQDKLVVSHYQTKVSPVPLPDKKNTLIPIPGKVIHIHIPDKIIPPSPTSKPSNTSPTLTSTTRNNTTVSCSSSSSLSTASSSVSVSKNRSFSNEFLRACYRENPHIVRINSIREASLSLKTTKPPSPYRSGSPVRPSRSPSVPNRSNPNPKKGIAGSPMQKRIWANSPLHHSTLNGQKSFREDQERIVSSANSSTRFKVLKSPSPSRRFGMASSRVSPIGSVSSSLRRESADLGGSRTSLKNRSETRIHRISSKIDESAVKSVITSQNEPEAPSEDVENPLISLDCFIFL